MSTLPYLSEEEIRALTARSRPSAQQRWLEKLGVTNVQRRADGRLLVSRAAVERAAGAADPAPAPAAEPRREPKRGAEFAKSSLFRVS